MFEQRKRAVNPIMDIKIDKRSNRSPPLFHRFFPQKRHGKKDEPIARSVALLDKCSRYRVAEL